MGIPSANETRWNSVVRQVNAVISKGMAEMNAVSRADNRDTCIFSAIEWEQLTDISNILEPFRVITDSLQGDKVRYIIIVKHSSLENIVYSMKTCSCLFLVL